MHDLANYLSIASIAHRQATELKERAADTLPPGIQTFIASEIACCEAIIASVRAVVSQASRTLEFSHDGKAMARIPALLAMMGEEEVISET